MGSHLHPDIFRSQSFMRTTIIYIDYVNVKKRMVNGKIRKTIAQMGKKEYSFIIFQ